MATQIQIQKLADDRTAKKNATTWVVVSNAPYEVVSLPEGFYCRQLLGEGEGKKICKAWQYCRGARIGKTCKHVEAVKLFEAKSQ